MSTLRSGQQLSGWNPPRTCLQFRWLGRELLIAVARTAILSGLAWFVARKATRTTRSVRRARWVAVLPLLIIADLLGSHWYDVPTIDPRYWTEPPESVARLKSDPGLIRIFGNADKSAARAGVRLGTHQLLWRAGSTGLEPAGGLEAVRSRGARRRSSRGGISTTRTMQPVEDNSISRASPTCSPAAMRRGALPVRSRPVGTAFIHRNDHALPRVRLAGKPLYAKDVAEAIALIDRLTKTERLREHVIVEDPTRPLPADAVVTGSARIAAGDPRTTGGRDGGCGARLSCCLRLVRPGMVGHGRRQAGDDLPGLLRIPGGLSSAGEARRRLRVQPGGLQARARDQPLRCSCRTRVLVLAETIDSARQ